MRIFVFIAALITMFQSPFLSFASDNPSMDRLDAKIQESPTLIGCYVKGKAFSTDESHGCRGNGIYLPPKSIWEIYKNHYDLSNNEEAENLLISMTHANLESGGFDNEAIGPKTKSGQAYGMYQMLAPAWGKVEDIKNPNWSIPVMKEAIQTRKQQYKGDILMVFQKHFGIKKNGDKSYGRKYKVVFDFYKKVLY